MKALEVFDDLRTRCGQHVKVSWQRSCKVKKSAGQHTVHKRTVAFVRAGITYGNLASVRNEIEAGTRDEVQSLPWGTWREGFKNFIIDHKGTEYIRLYPPSFENLKQPEVTWLLDGRAVSYEEVEPYLLASEKRKDKDEEGPACFTVKADDIVTIAD